MSWFMWTLLKHMLSLLHWPDLLEQGVVVVLQVALPPRLCSPVVAGAHYPQTWLTAWSPACCCLGAIRQLMLSSCLCCLPKPARDLCATGHLAWESQPPATPCLSPATHHVPERSHKILFAQPFSSAPLSWIRQGLLLLSFAGNYENLPFSTTATLPFCFLPPEALCTQGV